MCVVSMVGDHYADKWQPRIPEWFPYEPVRNPGVVTPLINITREEFDALKQDVEEMKQLLKRAKDYDERNGEPDCEIDEKMDLLRHVAKLVGVDLDDVLGAQAKH